MKKKLLFTALALSIGLATFAQDNGEKTIMTTNNGAPIGDNQNSKTVGEYGPVLLEDIHLVEKLAAFDRERIPERVVHPRGAGASVILRQQKTCLNILKLYYSLNRERKQI